MKKSLWIVGAILAAAAPGTARQTEEPLILKARRIDVRIRENLALVRFEVEVENPTVRPREGELLFSAPDGAAVFESTLVKNVSSKDRVSKLIGASVATSAYEAVKKEVGQAAQAREASDMSGQNLLAGAMKAPPVFSDPALLELLAGHSYRLRFCPVMPRDDQKVTVTLAVEATRVGDSYELRIPVPEVARVERRKGTTEKLRVLAASSGTVENLSSETHDLRRAADGALESELRTAPALVLRYGLSRQAKVTEVADKQDGAFATEEWARAIRALREVRGIHKGEPVAVSRENSILVIDRSELKRLQKQAAK